MYYISKTPTENGNYGAPMGQPFPDSVELPDGLLATYLSAKGFVDITVQDGTVSEVRENEAARAAWEAEHPAPEVDLDALRVAKQEQNKQALADWLAAHPLTWIDGNVYGTTKEDQDEMNLNFAQYQLAVMAGEENPILEWHTQKKRCHTFTREEFTALALEIRAYVYPYRRYMEAIKEDIYMAQSKEELDAIEIDYGSVGAAA